MEYLKFSKNRVLKNWQGEEEGKHGLRKMKDLGGS